MRWATHRVTWRDATASENKEIRERIRLTIRSKELNEDVMLSDVLGRLNVDPF